MRICPLCGTLYTDQQTTCNRTTRGYTCQNVPTVPYKGDMAELLEGMPQKKLDKMFNK